MDWTVSLSLAIFIMLGLFFVGTPVFVAFLIINLVGVFWLFGSSGYGLFANSIYQTVTAGSLAAVPLFVLMGEILFRSGTIDRLISSVDELVGRLKGRGLYPDIPFIHHFRGFVRFGRGCGRPPGSHGHARHERAWLQY